jgi:hypothetical protein
VFAEILPVVSAFAAVPPVFEDLALIVPVVVVLIETEFVPAAVDRDIIVMFVVVAAV